MKVSREFVRDGKTVAVTAECIAGDRWRVRVGDAVHEYQCKPTADGGIQLQTVGEGAPRACVAYGAPVAKAFMVRVDGRTHTLAPPSRQRSSGGGGADGVVRAPMTGTVLEVVCKVGDQVAADQTLAVVSAMKMEHKLIAGVAGVVREVAVAKGATVEQGAKLVVVEPKQETKA